jgi:hypothetical protein
VRDLGHAPTRRPGARLGRRGEYRRQLANLVRDLGTSALSVGSATTPRCCCVARPEAVLVADRLAVRSEPGSGSEAGRRIPGRRCERGQQRQSWGWRLTSLPARIREGSVAAVAISAGPRIRTARRRGSGPAEHHGLQGHGSTG